MKRLLLATASVATLFAGMAVARADDSDLALQLGIVFGSEQACGLTYD